MQIRGGAVWDREVGGSNPLAPINEIKKLRLPFLEAFLFKTLSTTLSITNRDLFEKSMRSAFATTWATLVRNPIVRSD
jgi:hypothetical protein